MKPTQRIFYSFGLLLFCFTSKVAYAQQIDGNCNKANLEKSVCINNGGTVIHNNQQHYHYYYSVPPSPTSIPSTGAKQQRNLYQISNPPVPQKRLTSGNKPLNDPIWHNDPNFIVK